MIIGRALALALFTPALLIHSQDTTRPSPPLRSHSSKPNASEALQPGVNSTYVIGSSDVLLVTVLKETTLSGTLLVRPDGIISMPLLGDVMATGMTPKELAEEISNRLKKYIQDPNVTVIVTQVNSKKVYLIGEVGRVGPVDITPGMTLLEAMSSAGGLTQYANYKKMYILRTEGKTYQRIPVRYKQALRGESASNLMVKPGDTIVVP